MDELIKRGRPLIEYFSSVKDDLRGSKNLGLDAVEGLGKSTSRVLVLHDQARQSQISLVWIMCGLHIVVPHFINEDSIQDDCLNR